MKYLLLLIILIAAEKSFSQIQTHKSVLSITAKDAFKRIGEIVAVHDSLYSGKDHLRPRRVTQRGPCAACNRSTNCQSHTGLRRFRVHNEY